MVRTEKRLVSAAGAVVLLLSSGVAFGQAQSPLQQNCINALNAGGARVADTQGRANTSCIRRAGRGEEPEAQDCLTRDGKGGLAQVISKIEADFDRKCTSDPPDFGVRGTPAAVGRAGLEDQILLVADIFGNPLDDAVDTTRDGSRCQSVVSSGYERTFAAYMDGFRDCTKKALRAGGNESDLEACVLDDSSGQAGRAADGLATRIHRTCTENLFPGKCAGASLAELGDCIHEVVRHRACRTQNAMDGLHVNCPDPKQTEEIGRCADFDPLRRAYFGETHIHTNRSLDAIALVGDTQLSASRVLGPLDSYRYARGEPIEIPTTLDGTETETIQIERPLDFAGIADHAEYLGVAPMCNDPSSAAYDDVLCRNVRIPELAPQTGGVTGGGSGPFFAATSGLLFSRHPLCGDEGEDCLQYADDVWEEIQEAAETAYDRTDACSFATLVGYEWTLTPLGDNLHRNVFFRNEIVPARPISVAEASTPPALWTSLRNECIATDTACDVLAIPHNSNRSAGRAFADDKNLALGPVSEPIDKAYAIERQRMEPLVEVYQIKGSSECHTMLSSDEECGFDSGVVRGFIGATTPPRETQFARNALGLGLEYLERLGANPFQFGLIAATDAHDGRTGGAILDEVLAQERAVTQDFSMNNMPNNTGGLAGVWAEENTREAIFVAMRRRETFGTSGPRIRPRFFSAWGLPAGACDDPLAAIEHAYDVGVPMGGKLWAPPDQASVPHFLVMAEADIEAPIRGTVPLTAIQIIKVWLEDGEYQERVYDVAGEISETHTVDPETCESTAPVDAPLELCSVWTDPDFDSSEHAVYYARVLEHSTCRHSTLTCNAGFDCDNPTTQADLQCCNPRFGFDRSSCEADPPDCSNPASVPRAQRNCCLPIVEPLVRQRAWTSPIWYEASATDTR